MRTSRRQVLVGASLLGIAALSQGLRPRPVADGTIALDSLIPERFDDWQVDPSIVPVAPSPDVQANLDQLYDQIVARTYVDTAGTRMMLVVAYGGDQSDSLKAHRQEVCYAAQGFSVQGVARDVLAVDGQSVPLVRLHAVKARRSEPVSYWFTMGDKVALGRVDRLLTQVRHGLAGRIPDGMLVRVSNLSTDTVASYRSHDAFLRALLRAAGPQARQRLAGVTSVATPGAAS